MDFQKNILPAIREENRHFTYERFEYLDLDELAKNINCYNDTLKEHLLFFRIVT